MTSFTTTRFARVAEGLKHVFRSVWFRVVFALVVLCVLVGLNRISVTTFSSLASQWPWLVAAFALMLPPYLIVSCRFWIVLNNQGITVPFVLAWRWTMIGSFFDLAMPSNSGGDLIKGAYVVQHAGSGMRTRAVMAVAFDRVLGLIGLFLLASVAIMAGWNSVKQMPGSSNLLTMLPAVTIGALAVFRFLGSRRLVNNDRFRQTVVRLPAGQRIYGIVASFNLLRERPAQFFVVLLLSLINHSFWCASLLCVTFAFGMSADLLQAFAVFPIAIFGNTFGFAGGFGLGTAAFDLVFSTLFHVSVGAAVGLTFQALGAISRLSGLPFYISHPQYSLPASSTIEAP